MTAAVRAQQVWADGDPRAADRELLVLEVHEEASSAGRVHSYALCEVIGTGRRTKIKLSRLGKRGTKGYRLVKDA